VRTGSVARRPEPAAASTPSYVKADELGLGMWVATTNSGPMGRLSIASGSPNKPAALSGIGAVTAAQLLSRGFRVLGTSRRPESIQSANPEIEYLELDLTDSRSIERCAAAAGPVDVLINNAGESQSGPLEQLPMDSVERLFHLNVFGPEIARLRAQLSKAERRLARTEVALDIMGKAHALLEEFSESAQDEPRPTRR
jgi:hypothetical protein